MRVGHKLENHQRNNCAIVPCHVAFSCRDVDRFHSNDALVPCLAYSENIHADIKTESRSVFPCIPSRAISIARRFTTREPKARMSSSSSSSPTFSLTLDLRPVDDAKFLRVTERVERAPGTLVLVELSGDCTKTPSSGDQINNSFYARMISRRTWHMRYVCALIAIVLCFESEYPCSFWRKQHVHVRFQSFIDVDVKRFLGWGIICSRILIFANLGILVFRSNSSATERRVYAKRTDGNHRDSTWTPLPW